jgi:hypothetical protein
MSCVSMNLNLYRVEWNYIISYPTSLGHCCTSVMQSLLPCCFQYVSCFLCRHALCTIIDVTFFPIIKFIFIPNCTFFLTRHLFSNILILFCHLEGLLLLFIYKNSQGHEAVNMCRRCLASLLFQHMVNINILVRIVILWVTFLTSYQFQSLFWVCAS